jgi:hypothetical protein
MHINETAEAGTPFQTVTEGAGLDHQNVARRKDLVNSTFTKSVPAFMLLPT